MLDDLRNSADSSFYEEDPLEQPTERPQRRQLQMDRRPPTATLCPFTTLFLFFMVAILGVFLLIVYQKVSIPV
mgnify:CR=1 FL=1